PAERRKRIATIRGLIRLVQNFVFGHTGGIIMFDNDRRRIVKGHNKFQSGVKVQKVIEREFFAVQLLKDRQSAGILCLPIQRRGLMGILAIPQVLQFSKTQQKFFGKVGEFIRVQTVIKEMINDVVVARGQL